jgi:hypothetical protein
MPLFAEISFVGNQQAWLAEAASDVEAIDRRDMLSPNLATRIAQIAARYAFGEAPVLKLDGMRGERRDVDRVINDYGMRRAVRIAVLEVFIPFDGDGEWFRYQPSRCSLIDTPVEIREQSLVITLRDEPPESQRQHIDRLVQMVKGNLDALKHEVEAFTQQVSQVLDTAAKHRLAQIKAEGERDSKLGFPVT